MASTQRKNALSACPCCGYATIEPGADHEICAICFWEDDGRDEEDADDGDEESGPNQVSLTEGRMNFLKCGASDPKDLPHCRSPNENDERLRHFTIIDDRIIETKSV